MNAKNLWLKFAVVGLLVVVCLWSLLMGKGLRQGIDLRGGHSLIFEIRTNKAEIERLEARKKDILAKLGAAGDEERRNLQGQLDRIEDDLERYKGARDIGDVTNQMIAILKKRVDPDGLRSLEWRPLSNNRIEIRMPAGDPEVRENREAYWRALDRLEANNIQASEIRSVLRSGAKERSAKIERLTRGDVEQARRFAALADAHDELSDSEAALAEAKAQRIKALQATSRPANLAQLDEAVARAQDRFDNAQVDYEQKLKALRKGNISRQRLQDILNQYLSPAQAKKIVDKKERARRQETYKEHLRAIEAEHPARAGEIRQVARLYEKWADGRQRLDDPDDLKRLIKKAGVLEFRIAPFAPRMNHEGSLTNDQRNRYIESLRTEGPEGLKRRNDRLQWFPVAEGVTDKDMRGLVTAKDKDKDRLYVLLYDERGKTMLRQTGARSWSLTDARRSYDDMGGPAIHFELDSLGAKRMAKLTADHQTYPMAILLDDEVYSAPVIKKDAIISDSGVITGRFTPDEVNDLVRTLRAGSLPGRLNPDPVSENMFAPSIGAVNRERGKQAAIWGLIAVAAFMLIYYQLAGLIANVALVLNIVLVLGTMSLINAVFTLPGIAGVILTIGIAVDANVLIFERLREEQAKGQSVRQALKNAYERAFSAIFDANITTLLVCLILGWVGTEEVRGFAITLGLGVTFSLFSALVVTRWIFQLLLDARLLKKPIFMLKIVGVPKINWMRKRYVFWGLTALFVALGIASLVGQGGDIWGIEFSAGTQAMINFRDDALIDGKLPDDALVREKFGDKAGELGYDKLQATAIVETRIDPDRVGDFIRDYDNRDDPDGAVSLAEWRARKMRVEFFEKIDADGDNVLSRQELADRLPQASFQVSTTETKVSRIHQVAREAFGQSLEIRAARSFEQVAGGPVEELGVSMPVNGRLRITQGLRRQVKAAYREEFLDYEDGVLFVIRDVRPAISKTELVQRIREMRFQPDFKEQMLSQTNVLGLTPAGEDEFSAFAILVRPAEIELLDKPGAWDEFAAGEWALIDAALRRESAMLATNFDAAIAGERAIRAGIALVISWALIVAYLWFRFGNWRWGLAAVICLIHDVIIVVGLVAASAWVQNTFLGPLLGIRSFKIDLAMVAAILTVIGYSVNDTIVVFDRIRENRGKLATVSAPVINASINQTLARTLLTSGTTFIVVILMYVVGGAGVHAFSYALLVGVLFGTYSSVAVASPLLMGFKQALVARTTSAVAENE